MAASKNNKSKFTFENAVVVAAVLIVSLLGYGYFVRAQHKSDGNSAAPQQVSATANDVAQPPTISTTADLDKSIQVLDGTDTSGGTDASDLNYQLSAF